MASLQKKNFLAESARISFDKRHRSVIRFNMAKYEAAVRRGKLRYCNLSLAKERASFIKNSILENWDTWLEMFERNMSARGVDVLWAEHAEEAMALCLDIFRKSEVKRVVKSKSMITEEIGFNEACEKEGIEVLETDLGEYIVQVAGEKPYHIVTPAMHKSRGDVALLFHQKFGMKADSSPEEITLFVRNKLKKAFKEADAGITGANYLVADPGAVGLTENEGNGLMTTAFPRLHIVFAGIERLIPSLVDLNDMWPWLALHGTGQQITSYNSVFFGPKKPGESNGPEKMTIILVDNGRSLLFGKNESFAALKCIRCGACLNACPVYKNIGGYTYDCTYSGPIGAVISPHFLGLQPYGHLSFASSLCGKCEEVCPVEIPLPALLLQNRNEFVQSGFGDSAEGLGMKAFGFVARHRVLLNLGAAGLRCIRFHRFRGPISWGSLRALPEFRPSFSSQWKKNSEKF
jgi:L-lactate dehydrogenase complex protein LldF